MWTLGTDDAGLLAELATLGPFFAVQTHCPGGEVPAPWQPLDTLLGSAINGAAFMISTARPPLRPRAIRLSQAALRFPELAGGYRGQPTTSFQRRSCCLIYRIAENPQYCGDCVLEPGTASR